MLWFKDHTSQCERPPPSVNCLPKLIPPHYKGLQQHSSPLSQTQQVSIIWNSNGWHPRSTLLSTVSDPGKVPLSLDCREELCEHRYLRDGQSDVTAPLTLRAWLLIIVYFIYFLPLFCLSIYCHFQFSLIMVLLCIVFLQISTCQPWCVVECGAAWRVIGTGNRGPQEQWFL